MHLLYGIKAPFRRDKPMDTRPIDLGALSFRYPVYLGDDERNRVYDLFAHLGPAAGLRESDEHGADEHEGILQRRQKGGIGQEIPKIFQSNEVPVLRIHKRIVKRRKVDRHRERDDHPDEQQDNGW